MYVYVSYVCSYVIMYICMWMMIYVYVYTMYWIEKYQKKKIGRKQTILALKFPKLIWTSLKRLKNIPVMKRISFDSEKFIKKIFQFSIFLINFLTQITGLCKSYLLWLYWIFCIYWTRQLSMYVYADVWLDIHIRIPYSTENIKKKIVKKTRLEPNTNRTSAHRNKILPVTKRRQIKVYRNIFEF